MISGASGEMTLRLMISIGGTQDVAMPAAVSQ
jgi:hypothetical protein